MNPKLKAIAEKWAEDMQAFVRDDEPKILEAWNAAEADAQENGDKPKFRLALTVTLDLEADKMETALSYGIRRKTSAVCQIPDPNQQPLPLEEVPEAVVKGLKKVGRK